MISIIKLCGFLVERRVVCDGPEFKSPGVPTSMALSLHVMVANVGIKTFVVGVLSVHDGPSNWTSTMCRVSCGTKVSGCAMITSAMVEAIEGLLQRCREGIQIRVLEPK